MAITADDIQNVSFTLARDGYDVDEVDVFLERVADEIDAMNRQIADLQAQLEQAGEGVVAPVAAAEPTDEPAGVEEADARIDELMAEIEDLKAQLSEKNANAAAISQALIVAQRSADDVIANAKSQATAIVQDADAEASRIVDDAEGIRQSVLNAIQTLEADRNEVRAQYRDMLSNFVADAQRKLADIEGDLRSAANAAQVRTDSNASSYAPLETFTVGGGAQARTQAPMAAPAYAAPAATQAAAPVNQGYVEKDFSGFGDAVDDFGFDDLD